MYNGGMDFKKLGVALLVLIVVAAGFGLWASRANAPGLVLEERHILTGTTTPQGDYKYTEDAPYYTITARYPAGRLAIETALAANIAQFKEDGNFANLTAEDVQIQGLGPDRKYALDMEYKTYQSPAYTSYLYTVYADTLGAHPNGYFLTFVFDKQGNEVSLVQLFPNNPSWLEELSLTVSEDVVAQLKQRTGLDDITGSVFAEGLATKEENFQNFIIDGDTLVIEIPPYQVAAYALGSFEVKTPLKGLQ